MAEARIRRPRRVERHRLFAATTAVASPDEGILARERGRQRVGDQSVFARIRSEQMPVEPIDLESRDAEGLEDRANVSVGAECEDAEMPALCEDSIPGQPYRGSNLVRTADIADDDSACDGNGEQAKCRRLRLGCVDVVHGHAVWLPASHAETLLSTPRERNASFLFRRWHRRPGHVGWHSV